jgi:hypothetical protein
VKRSAWPFSTISKITWAYDAQISQIERAHADINIQNISASSEYFIWGQDKSYNPRNAPTASAKLVLMGSKLESLIPTTPCRKSASLSIFRNFRASPIISIFNPHPL